MINAIRHEDYIIASGGVHGILDIGGGGGPGGKGGDRIGAIEVHVKQCGRGVHHPKQAQ